MLLGKVGAKGHKHTGLGDGQEVGAGSRKLNNQSFVIGGIDAYIVHLCYIQHGLVGCGCTFDKVGQVGCVKGVVGAVADGPLDAVDKIVGGQRLSIAPLHPVNKGKGIGQAIVTDGILLAQVVDQLALFIFIKEGWVGGKNRMVQVGSGVEGGVQGKNLGSDSHRQFLSRSLSRSAGTAFSISGGTAAENRRKGQDTCQQQGYPFLFHNTPPKNIQ